MPHTQPGGPVRWIVGGLSAAALVAGVGLLLSDISRRTPPPPRSTSAPPGGPPMQGNLPMPPAFGSVTPGAATAPPIFFPDFNQLWRLTPTTLPLTKIPEGKAFLASFRTMFEIKVARYGHHRTPPLPPEELAQIMIETKSQKDLPFRPPFFQGVRLWQVARLGKDFYLRAWKLPDGTPSGTSYPTETLHQSNAVRGAARQGNLPAHSMVNGRLQITDDQAGLKFTLFNRPDHPEVPSGVKLEPLQVPIQALGTERYLESSGTHFARLQLSSLLLDSRAKEKWSSLSLPTVPQEHSLSISSGVRNQGGEPTRSSSAGGTSGRSNPPRIRPGN